MLFLARLLCSVFWLAPSALCCASTVTSVFRSVSLLACPLTCHLLILFEVFVSAWVLLARFTLVSFVFRACLGCSVHGGVRETA